MITVSAGQPLYGRVLRLRHLRLGTLVSSLLFECMIALAVLLALAELVSWWAVLALPLSIAAMVKANDLVVAALHDPAQPAVADGEVNGSAAGADGQVVGLVATPAAARAGSAIGRNVPVGSQQTAGRAGPVRLAAGRTATAAGRTGTAQRTGSGGRAAPTRSAGRRTAAGPSQLIGRAPTIVGRAPVVVRRRLDGPGRRGAADGTAPELVRTVAEPSGRHAARSGAPEAYRSVRPSAGNLELGGGRHAAPGG